MTDTFISSVGIPYYNLVFNRIKDARGIENKIIAVLDIVQGNIIKKIIINLLSISALVGSLIYSWGEFSLCQPAIIGTLYIIFLVMPSKEV